LVRPCHDVSSVLPLGPTAFYILLALADSERHGSDIAEEVECTTDGAIRILPGALYRYLKQMVTDGWIVESETGDDDGRKRYYELTPLGRRIAQAEAQRLDNVVQLARIRRLLPSIG